MKVPAAFLSFVLALYGCGGGGGGATFPGLPALMPAQGKNAPIVFLRDGVQVGADAMPARSSLSPAGTHGEVAISTGRVRDGESAENVKEYLKQHSFVSESTGDDFSFLLFNTRPVVRIRDSTPDKYMDDIIRVVQLMNQALPYNHRKTISPSGHLMPRP